MINVNNCNSDELKAIKIGDFISNGDGKEGRVGNMVKLGAQFSFFLHDGDIVTAICKDATANKLLSTKLLELVVALEKGELSIPDALEKIRLIHMAVNRAQSGPAFLMDRLADTLNGIK